MKRKLVLGLSLSAVTALTLMAVACSSPAAAPTAAPTKAAAPAATTALVHEVFTRRYSPGLGLGTSNRKMRPSPASARPPFQEKSPRTELLLSGSELSSPPPKVTFPLRREPATLIWTGMTVGDRTASAPVTAPGVANTLAE